MRKDDRHTATEGGAEAARPERPGAHEEAVQKDEASPHSENAQRGEASEEVKQQENEAESFASTPETRAEEGVEWDTDPGSVSHSDNATAPQEAPQPVIAPVPAPSPASTYDPYAADRYDVYRQHLYDEDWLQDDYYYHEQYYHDDRHPYLYYDNYYGNEALQPSYTPPSYHYVEAAAPSYGLFDYVDRHYETQGRHERAWEHAGDYSEIQHRDIEPDSAPRSEPYFAQGNGAGDQSGKNAEHQQSGYEYVSNQQTAQQYARYEHVEPAASPFVHSSAIAAGAILAAEQTSDRSDVPLISPAWSEAACFSSESSFVPEYASAAPVSHQEFQGVSAGYASVAVSSGPTEHAASPIFSHVAERDAEPGLVSHSSGVLLPSLSQSELHALEMRASEAQPLVNAPAVPEVVVPLAAQHVQEPIRTTETQHPQGFAVPLTHPAERDNSTLVYNSLSYVNHPENAVSREGFLVPQADYPPASNAADSVLVSSAVASLHQSEHHSFAEHRDVLVAPSEAGEGPIAHFAQGGESYAHPEADFHTAAAPLAASVLLASSPSDGEKRLPINQIEVSREAETLVASETATVLASAANDSVTPLVHDEGGHQLADTILTSSVSVDNVNGMNELISPQVRHTFTQIVDNPSKASSLLKTPDSSRQILDHAPISTLPIYVAEGASRHEERAAHLIINSETAATSALPERADKSSLVAHSEREPQGAVIKSEAVASSVLVDREPDREVLLPAVVSQSVRSSDSASDVLHVTNASSDGTNDLINGTNEVKGFRVLDEDGNPLAFEVLLPHAAAAGATPAEAKDVRALVRDGSVNPLVMEEAVAAQVLSGKSVDGILDPRAPGFALKDGADAHGAVDSNGQTARSSVPEKGEGGKGSSTVLHNAGVIAGAAALGGVRFAGKAAKEVLGFAGVAANQLLREDEDLSRIAQADDMIHDGIVATQGAGGSSRTSLAERLIRSEIAAEDQLQPGPSFSQTNSEAPSPVVSADEKAARGKHAAAKQPTLHEKVDSVGAKELLVSTKEAEVSLLSDSLTGAERMSASLREASDGGAGSIEGLLSLGSGEERDSKPSLASRSKAPRSEKRESVEGLLAEPVKEPGRVSVSEKGASAKAPAVVRGVGERNIEGVCGPKSSELAVEKDKTVKGLVTVKGKGDSALEDDHEAEGILDPKSPEDPKASKAKKKPATERERELAKKEAKRKAARKDGRGDSKAMSVVSAGKNAGLKSALFVGGVAKSGAKKLVSDRNEELAVAMSSVDKTKKTVRTARKIAHAPVFLMQQARRAIHTAVTAVKSVANGAAALTAMGPVGGLIALMAFVLLIVIIAVLLGTASIINDEQEVSEVSALVAELDAQLTEEVNALGHQPILYLDASDTYNTKDDDGKTLTKDADLADNESDLKEVVAESVTVRTDPAEIAAYIDAKYTGNWQVGAASWKYTIDAFGETWNLIEWEDMPEWAWKALNKVNRTDFKVTLRNELTSLLMEDFGVGEAVAGAIASDTADEFATVIFDNQIQGMNDDVLMQIIRDSVKAHKSDLDLSDDEVRKLYYRMQKKISDLIGEEDPFAFVYDEIVLLHERLNWWSEEYGSFGLATSPGAGSILSLDGTGSGTVNAYGYPNSYGYDEAELANWDGFNEVSVYGISEAGTTSVTADGTRITNTWADATMGIACEGLQNDVFAYWTPGYKSATGTSGDVPVKITLYNPATGKSITAEVIDCGGWRGFNERYAGKNLDRQWDLLPAVWKALGGAQEAGTMRVYWKVDPDAVVGQAALQPKIFEDYPWPKETDEENDEITLTRPTLIVHGVQDALMNDPLMEEIIDRDTFRTDAEFEAVKDFTVLKVKDVMKTLLTMENGEGEKFTDYNYLRRDLGSPFGEDAGGKPREWKISHRYDPGYEDFELDDAYVEVRPLGDATAACAVMAGEVEEVDDGEVTVRTYIDTANSAEVVYSTLKDVKVEEGDEVKEGQKLGTMKGGVLRVKWYEVNDAALQIETKKDWAYDVGLYMDGFAGYEEPEEPKEYVNMAGDWSGCSTVVEFARSRLGCPYVWGATGPDTFDCSGLTQWCYAQAGISIPRNSEAQRAGGQVVPLSEVQPGDILWKPGHVGIYIGENLYIHAPHTGDVVKISGNAKGYFTVAVRYE